MYKSHLVEVWWLIYFHETQHDYVLIHKQNIKHSKLTVEYGISFSLPDKWLTLVINELLETNNKDIDKPRQMKKKEENEITQVTSKY